ncbi:MAG: polysaccharide biosynthesis/export family protein [Candidatus Melainabacteria bacterium]|nr:polysaccharide biosynthesis/export family protein [Candidatus Melainabacteria bacterium]
MCIPLSTFSSLSLAPNLKRYVIAGAILAMLSLQLGLSLFPGWGVQTVLAQTLDSLTVENTASSPTNSYEQALQAGLSGHVEYSQNRYRVGPGDVLKLFVYYQPDMSQDEILIRADGMASFNGVGEVSVGGKTVDEITRLLEQELGLLVKQPRITVSVTRTRPGVVYLAGALMKPGMVQMSTYTGNGAGERQTPIQRTDLRLTNVLANAGGVALNADLGNIRVTRAHTGIVQTVNLWQLLKTGSSDQDLWLQSGDSVFVPPLPQMALNDEDYILLLRSSIGPSTFPVRLIGQVGKPGVVELEAKSPFLNTALSRAEGFAPGANKKVIAIRRFSSETAFSNIMIDPNRQDVVLRPNDVIFVSEAAVYKAGRFGEQVAKVFQPFTNAAWAASGSAQVFGIGGFRTFR